jgi:hypothetical protein
MGMNKGKEKENKELRGKEYKSRKYAGKERECGGIPRKLYKIAVDLPLYSLPTCRSNQTDLVADGRQFPFCHNISATSADRIG